jgi:hypothetical protein
MSLAQFGCHRDRERFGLGGGEGRFHIHRHHEPAKVVDELPGILHPERVPAGAPPGLNIEGSHERMSDGRDTSTGVPARRCATHEPCPDRFLP